jgi:hypothetical protein
VTVAPVWIAVVALYALAGLVSPAMLQAGQVLNILQVASFPASSPPARPSPSSWPASTCRRPGR